MRLGDDFLGKKVKQLNQDGVIEATKNRQTNTCQRIFLIYKRDAEPDEPVALQIFQALSQHHEVFINFALCAWLGFWGGRWKWTDFHRLNQAVLKGESMTKAIASARFYDSTHEC